MNIDRARNILIPRHLQAIDIQPFLAIPSKIYTMAKPRFLATMNNLVQCIDGSEVYMEVGTYQGGSLVGALLNNTAKAVAIDNFSEFKDTNTETGLLNNLVKFGVRERVTFHNVNYRSFIGSQYREKNIGVYYYDGAHDWESTLVGLLCAYPFVVNNGLMVLDDTLYPEVCVGLSKFIAQEPDVKVVFAVSPATEFDDDWWNGTVVLQKVGE